LLTRITQPISPSELRERVYRGEILHFHSLPAIKAFCQSARAICEESMDCSSPVDSHRHIGRSEWQKKVFQYQQTARHSQDCFVFFSNALQDLGLDLNQIFCDRFIFRAVPPQSFNAKGAHSWVDTHRDTWGAGIYQQINWWGPVYPYPESTGIEFYTDQFDQAVANTSADWRYEKYLSARKQQTAELKPDYKSIPSLLEKPRGQVLRPNIEPGDMLCFSAAHLHGSSINNTNNCRFSFETRTVNLDDIQSGRKAPNCDNDSNDQLLKLFHNIIDDRQLEEKHFKQ
jgi:hypothetical protein